MKALVKKSNIAVLKSKFFINRTFSYFSFLLLPVWIQKSLELNIYIQALLMLFYMLFMTSQWFLLGKEIDHRLKIYFRANSSIDRVTYRIVIGSTFTIIIFNLFSFLPDSMVKHFFWGFWVVLGLYYSWPTRGKIIRESVSTQFSEYRFLDSFEKTVLFLAALVFLVSIPNFPYFENLDSLKLVIDPDEKISQQLWNFLQISYFPFKKIPHLVYLGWCLHFYVIGGCLFLGAFYGLCRFFFSRRLAILGVFATVSTWSFSLILEKDPFSVMLTSYSAIWVWSMLWCLKSSTYRAGLLLGLVSYLGACLNYNFIWLAPLSIGVMYFVFMKDKTDWYKKQFLKYTSLGLFLCILVVLFHVDLALFEKQLIKQSWLGYIENLFQRKAFFFLSILGLIQIVVLRIKYFRNKLPDFNIDYLRLFQFFICLTILGIIGSLFEKNLIHGMSMVWVLTFLSLLPLEWIFQVISRMRSKRNVIYTIYVLVCLLDSHFEGRVRITAKFFQNTQVFSQKIK